MSKTVVRIRASESANETRLPAAESSRSVDPRAIHRVRDAAPGKSTNASHSSDSLFAALTQSLAPLLAETAHDLSNALGSLHLYLDLLEMEADNAENVRQRLREIRPAVRHAEDMTRQLLDPVKLDPAKLDDPVAVESAAKLGRHPARKISLNPVLQRMVPMLSAMLQPDIVLHLTLAPDLVPVAIDPTQIVRIVSNLVLNSRDAMCREGMSPNGELAIETANWRIAGKQPGKPPPKPGAPAQESGLEGTGDISWVLLRVRDSGTGMTNATLARIFQPFFTTKPPGEGSGLGLSSVLRMVQHAGGTIQVESALEKGTDITILFPSTSSRIRKAPQHLQPVSSANRNAELLQSEIQRSPSQRSPR
jgi:two-component system cell cycle sensor histidine kinase/response regulator CckA